MYSQFVSLLGKRPTNEDQHDIIENMNGADAGKKRFNFYGLYDGHGGKEVSDYIKKNLSAYFIRSDTKYSPSDNKYAKYIKKVYNHIQNKLVNDNKLISTHTGSTALTVMISNNKIYVVNLGDSRTVLCNKYCIAVPLTKDHKPNMYYERSRIIAGGGEIVPDGGDWRVCGLSVSRAFGDVDAKGFVIQDPDVYKYEIQKKDKFIIMGCDGLWDVLSNQDAVDFVVEKMDTAPKNNVAKQLGEFAIKSGSTDNITVIIIFFI
ncbi:MAG: serine/threonine protein phosphatase [Faunusvirus sp.]|jgi:serine/threonine protein phosphatase PrpC|uniref:Serine/threonine protein phosphatase n=1 Tax=Faunusvirus sp. TaxID=2487766 RepID=A0A3G4ZWG4_9VIRU|nr:MAG: serine/threonine protein phosphatase [Faunusvirus sp.]